MNSFPDVLFGRPRLQISYDSRRMQRSLLFHRHSEHELFCNIDRGPELLVLMIEVEGFEKVKVEVLLVALPSS